MESSILQDVSKEIRDDHDSNLSVAVAVLPDALLNTSQALGYRCGTCVKYPPSIISFYPPIEMVEGFRRVRCIREWVLTWPKERDVTN